MDIILKYFPDLTPAQVKQFTQLQQLYSEWNERINVISRKDIENLYERHVLHSLAIAKFVHFKDGTKIMDLGSGGGFPGVPLAIMFPECRFHLVDSINKKLNVIDAVTEATGIKNVFTFHSRAEQMDFQYDFVVTRAVAPLSDLLNWTKHKYIAKDRNDVKNGLIALKGGNLDEEIAQAGLKHVLRKKLSDYFNEPFFGDKYLIYTER